MVLAEKPFLVERCMKTVWFLLQQERWKQTDARLLTLQLSMGEMCLTETSSPALGQRTTRLLRMPSGQLLVYRLWHAWGMHACLTPCSAGSSRRHMSGRGGTSRLNLQAAPQAARMAQATLTARQTCSAGRSES